MLKGDSYIHVVRVINWYNCIYFRNRLYTHCKFKKLPNWQNKILSKMFVSTVFDYEIFSLKYTYVKSIVRFLIWVTIHIGTVLKSKSFLILLKLLKDLFISYRVSQNSLIPNSERGREGTSEARKILWKNKFALPEEDMYIQPRAINFGRQGHSLTQSKMLHSKTVVNIITYHHVV
jgi:hypothetical protein